MKPSLLNSMPPAARSSEKKASFRPELESLEERTMLDSTPAVLQISNQTMELKQHMMDITETQTVTPKAWLRTTNGGTGCIDYTNLPAGTIFRVVYASNGVSCGDKKLPEGSGTASLSIPYTNGNNTFKLLLVDGTTNTIIAGNNMSCAVSNGNLLRAADTGMLELPALAHNITTTKTVPQMQEQTVIEEQTITPAITVTGNGDGSLQLSYTNLPAGISARLVSASNNLPVNGDLALGEGSGSVPMNIPYFNGVTTLRVFFVNAQTGEVVGNVLDNCASSQGKLTRLPNSTAVQLPSFAKTISVQKTVQVGVLDLVPAQPAGAVKPAADVYVRNDFNDAQIAYHFAVAIVEKLNLQTPGGSERDRLRDKLPELIGNTPAEDTAKQNAYIAAHLPPPAWTNGMAMDIVNTRIKTARDQVTQDRNKDYDKMVNQAVDAFWQALESHINALNPSKIAASDNPYLSVVKARFDSDLYPLYRHFVGDDAKQVIDAVFASPNSPTGPVGPTIDRATERTISKLVDELKLHPNDPRAAAVVQTMGTVTRNQLIDAIYASAGLTPGQATAFVTSTQFQAARAAQSILDPNGTYVVMAGAAGMNGVTAVPVGVPGTFSSIMTIPPFVSEFHSQKIDRADATTVTYELPVVDKAIMVHGSLTVQDARNIRYSIQIKRVSDGKVIYTGNATGNKTISFDQIAAQGDYFINISHAPTDDLGDPQKGIHFSLDMKFEKGPFSSITGQVELNGVTHQVTLKGFGGMDSKGNSIEKLMDPSKSTSFVIPGRKDSPSSDAMKELAQSFLRNGDQVVTVDWSEAANDFIHLPIGLPIIGDDTGSLRDASWTKPVGYWLGESLSSLGFKGSSEHVGAHSHGVYVSFFLGEYLQKNNEKLASIIAMDPAYNPWFADNNITQDDIKLSSVSAVSWAFVASPFDSQTIAATANYSFSVKTPPSVISPFTQHNIPITLISNLLSNQKSDDLFSFFSYDLLLGKISPNSFVINPSQSNGNEGVIDISIVNGHHQDGSDWWKAQPTGVQYTEKFSGKLAEEVGHLSPGNTRFISGALNPLTNNHERRYDFTVDSAQNVLLILTNTGLDGALTIHLRDGRNVKVESGQKVSLPFQSTIGKNSFVIDASGYTTDAEYTLSIATP